MATKLALTLAAIIHFLLRVSIFIEPPINNCSTAPTLASLIYLASTLMIIHDYNIYPKRYSNIPTACQRFVEVIMILILIEFSTVIVWCSLERTLHRLLKCILFEKTSNMYYDMGGDFLAGALVIFSSVFIFINVAMATNIYTVARRKTIFLYNKIVEKITKIWGSLPLCYEKKVNFLTPLDPVSCNAICQSPAMKTRGRTTGHCSKKR